MNALIESVNLHGRVAIVSGGSKGIGRAVVLRLAQAGVQVVINYLTDEAGANESLRDVEKAGSKGISVRADVSKLGRCSFSGAAHVGRTGSIRHTHL